MENMEKVKVNVTTMKNLIQAVLKIVFNYLSISNSLLNTGIIIIL